MQKVVLKLCCFISLVNALTEVDVAGSRDHPIIGRYPGSIIRKYYQSEFEEYGLRMSSVESFVNPKGDAATVAGRVTRINYIAPAGKSSIEVFKNYEKALVDNGADVLWKCANHECGKGIAQAVLTKQFAPEVNLMGYNYDDQRYLAGKLKVGEQQYYLAVLTVGANNIGGSLKGRVFTQVDIVETKEMDTGLITINAEKLSQSIENEGRVAIYGIYFDFDKAIIKPESYGQIEEIAKMLKHKDGEFLVVGHTDNKGDLEYNQKLSQQRAKAVVEALTERGIPAARLIPVGVGMASPVATNDTEQGREKNRRVEIVKR